MLSNADLERIEAEIIAHRSGYAAHALLAEVKRLRSSLIEEDARLVESVRERDWLVSDGKYVQALLDLIFRYEHACHDRELDAGAFVAMERARIVAWLRERARGWRGIDEGTSCTIHGYAADLEAQGVADPAPPAVVRAELARVRAKVREVLAMNIPANIAALLREALEGEKTP